MTESWFHPGFILVIPTDFILVIPTEVERSKGLEALLVSYYVYILANWNNKVLYIGVTNNIIRRLYEHKNKLIDGFTAKYNVNKLVYFEITTDVYSAISREKQLKCWSRMKKEAIINKMNPFWNDLSYKCI